MGYSDYSSFEKEASRLGASLSDVNFLEKISLKVSGDAKIVKPLIEKYMNVIDIKEQKESLVKRRKQL